MLAHRLSLMNAVAAVFNDGIVLGTKELHYLESTFGSAGAETVAAMFSDEPDCEQQVFAQLVFFPDEVLQQRLEPIISHAAYDSSDRDAVMDALADRCMQTTLYFPGRETGMKVRIPEEALRQFLMRLNIEKIIAPEIVDTLSRCIPDPDEICRIRVMIRNARVLLVGPALDFFCACIETLHTDVSRFRQSLCLILTLLELPGQGNDFFEIMSAQKKRCLKMLHHAQKTSRALARQNVETLMLMGMHAGAVNTGEILRQIELIDHICLAVFGRTGFVPPPDEGITPVDVDISEGVSGMDRILRLLS